MVVQADRNSDVSKIRVLAIEAGQLEKSNTSEVVSWCIANKGLCVPIWPIVIIVNLESEPTAAVEKRQCFEASLSGHESDWWLAAGW